MKKNSEDDLWAQKIDFESQILALFAINATQSSTIYFGYVDS